jgi:hypothetical protein
MVRVQDPDDTRVGPASNLHHRLILFDRLGSIPPRLRGSSSLDYPSSNFPYSALAGIGLSETTPVRSSDASLMDAKLRDPRPCPEPTRHIVGPGPTRVAGLHSYLCGPLFCRCFCILSCRGYRLSGLTWHADQPFRLRNQTPPRVLQPDL